MTRWVLVAVVVAGCSKPAPPPSSSQGATAAAIAPATTANGCPPTGQWATCSIIYRLQRAGLAPKIDSSGTPNEKQLGGQSLMVKIGLSAELELHVFPDTTARAAGAATLDRTQFVNGTAEQTIKRERTLIESANVIGLLTSINAHQRERVSDALTAGPPRP